MLEKEMSQIVLYGDPILIRENKVKYFDITTDGWYDELEKVLNPRDTLFAEKRDLSTLKAIFEDEGKIYNIHVLDPDGIYVGEKRPYGLEILRSVFIPINSDVLQELAPYRADVKIYVQEGYDLQFGEISKKYPRRALSRYGMKEILESPELKDRERFLGTSDVFQRFVTERLESKMDVKFRPHQIKVAYAMVSGDPNIKGLIAAHDVGTGKTKMSLLSAISTRELRPDLKIDTIEIAVKPAIESQWDTEIKTFPLEFQKGIKLYKTDTLYNLLKVGKKSTPGEVAEALETYCQNKFLIIDEAHELRTKLPKQFKTGNTSLYQPEQLVEYIGKDKAAGKKPLIFTACAQKAPKILLLTGTVVVNEPADVVNLFNMILPVSRPLSDREIDEALREGDSNRIANRLRKKIGGLISVVSKDKSYYPGEIVQNVWIDMTPEYLEAYRAIERDEREKLFIPAGQLVSGAFYGNVRQASNVIDKRSPKIEVCLELIRKHTSVDDPLRRVLVYSPYKGYGVDVIRQNLDAIGMEYRQITGDETRDRSLMQSIKSWYNDADLTKPKILIISEAGSVGLDLKRTSAVILLQPNWNEAKDEQIIGRAVRSGSHADVPEKDRFVRVYHLFLKKPFEDVKQQGIDVLIGAPKELQVKEDERLATLLERGGEKAFVEDTTPSADFRLYQITREKGDLGSQFMKVLEELSI